MGTGHSVTALYEIIPVGVELDVELPPVDELAYQQNVVTPKAYDNNELMRVKLRYKPPEEMASLLIEKPVINRNITFDEVSESLGSLHPLRPLTKLQIT